MTRPVVRPPDQPRSAFGVANPNAGRPANGDRAAWGGWAWPNCPPANLQGTTDWTSSFGQRLRVSVRRELVELLTVMFQITDQLGYPTLDNLNGENWGPWGGQCRPVSGTSTPSGHSMWLSVDINAPWNPQSSTWQTNLPPAVVNAWERCGWFWGGRYTAPTRFDTMHFGYCFPPASVAGHLSLARQILGGTPQPPDNNGGDDDMALSDDDKRWIRQAVTDAVDERIRAHLGANAVSNPNTALNAGIMRRTRADDNAKFAGVAGFRPVS